MEKLGKCFFWFCQEHFWRPSGFMTVPVDCFLLRQQWMLWVSNQSTWEINQYHTGPYWTFSWSPRAKSLPSRATFVFHSPWPSSLSRSWVVRLNRPRSETATVFRSAQFWPKSSWESYSITYIDSHLISLSHMAAIWQQWQHVFWPVNLRSGHMMEVMRVQLSFEMGQCWVLQAEVLLWTCGTCAQPSWSAWK